MNQNWDKVNEMGQDLSDDISVVNASLSMEINNRQNEDAKKLPLTGGILSGPLNITDTITGRLHQLLSYNGEAVLRNYASEGDYAYIVVKPNSTALADGIKFGRYAVGEYKIYGEHNITVSTSAPSSALAEGAQHQVYA